jgi:hypothetical protein
MRESSDTNDTGPQQQKQRRQKSTRHAFGTRD